MRFRKSAGATSLANGARNAAVVLVAITLTLAAVAMWGINGVTGSLDVAIHEVDHELVPFLRVTANVRDALPEFANTLERSPSARVDEVIALVEADISELTEHGAIEGMPEEDELFDQGVSVWGSAVDSMAAVIDSGVRANDPAAYPAYVQLQESASLFSRAADVAMSDVARETAEARVIRQRALIAVTAAGLALIAATILISRHAAARILEGVRPLHDGAARVAAGDLTSQVPVGGPAEFADLAAAFNAMAEGISEREAQLTYRALRDPLTDLPNRRLLEERLGGTLARLRRHPGEPTAVMYIDLDGFKKVNDSFGHSAGDDTIAMAAQRLASSLRDGETLARLGGDEFSVIAEEAGEAANALGQRLVDVLRQPYTVGERHITLGASIGIAFAVTGHESPEDLLRDADLAMYRAKAAGGNRVCKFDGSLHQEAVERVQLEEDLRTAIGSEALEIAYLPVFDLDVGTLEGVEALVRWPHPERGYIPPLDFIPMAERTGLVIPLGNQVLRRAATEVQRWIENGAAPASFSLAVNVSARQLAEPDFVAQVEAQLRAARISPDRIVLEVTETSFLAHSEEHRERLEQLRALGIRVALDDFGTGYSSLQYLQELPVDMVKIDRSFVSGVSQRDDLLALVRTVLELATAFKFGVIAEGIEEQSDATTLRSLGCHLGQGFGLARPAPAAEILRLLRSNAAEAA